MTLDEAINILKQYVDYDNPDVPDFYTMAEAIEVVIKALEQEPCEDAISRQAVLEQINCWIDSGEYKYTNATYYLTKRMQGLPSVTPQPQKWIPVSERLPEENGVYIISYEDAVTWLEWFNGKWFFYPSNPAREETGTIIAWMPLPDPYKQEVEK